MGTGVMTGAGIFALTGQIAELYWALFPAGLFFITAIVADFSAYSYIKISNGCLTTARRTSTAPPTFGLSNSTREVRAHVMYSHHIDTIRLSVRTQYAKGFNPSSAHKAHLHHTKSFRIAYLYMRHGGKKTRWYLNSTSH